MKATKHVMQASVKSTADGGGFRAVASMPTLDRDGEIIARGAFEPLPDTVPIHAFHNFKDPVGLGRPYYQGEALMLEGTFASTARAQEIRTLVVDGVIGHMSVGFMVDNREDIDGVPYVTKGELLEVSFTTIPSNRESAVLEARAWRPVSADQRRLKALAEMVDIELRLMDARQVLVDAELYEFRTARDPEKARAALARAQKLLAQPPFAKSSKLLEQARRTR